MLRGFEHVGLTVRNIDRSLKFYVDLLGMSLVVRRPGLHGNEIAFVSTGNGMLELVCPATGALLAEDVAEGRAGVRHLTFSFDSVDETYRQLEEAGVEMVEAPRLAYNSDIVHKVAFCRDPDGVLIELTERSRNEPA
ncbi:VOC family protein [Chelativorans sp. AA-79]|uniref:VOC family protein n=1 Tax=Chelativorans sp. AA-79 TaxID=3028735 RepID=UPI0023F62A92|nr:VOC family protein [Chelativorans sp. AA-79]WEX08356.1 VOC family protein [Chelativorans sp. AA-79]